jgi:hypothetical protein
MAKFTHLKNTNNNSFTISFKSTNPSFCKDDSVIEMGMSKSTITSRT